MNVRELYPDLRERRKPLRLLGHEARVTCRLLADNVLVSSVPPLAFAVASALRFDLGAPQIGRVIVVAIVWSVLYIYVYDAANQIAGADEDACNKPYRPIPAGLVTVAGMRRRLVAGAVLYVGLSAWIGPVTLAAAVLWTAVALTHNLYGPPRHYMFLKPITLVVGVLTQLAGSWEIAHPLDATGWRWVIVIALMGYLPLPIEDVRDMAGDRAIGRRTLALLCGAKPIRAWFTATMLSFPLVAYLLLFRVSGAAPTVLWATTAGFAAICWLTGLYVALNNTRHANRMAYILFSVMYLALVAASLPLLT